VQKQFQILSTISI